MIIKKQFTKTYVNDIILIQGSKQKGRLNMNAKVLDYSIVSQISSLVGKYASWKKQLWKNDRKLYNKLKLTMEPVKSLKETTTHYIMSGNEVTIQKGLSMLKELRAYIESDNEVLMKLPYDQTAFNLITETREGIDSLTVFIEMADHENSIWNQ